MNKDIKGTIKTCNACQRSKTTRHERAKPGTDLSSQTRFKNIHLDLFGPFEQSSSGHKHLLTIFDRSTCFPVAVALINTDAQTSWKPFVANWIQLFGVPVNLVTDRGSQFTGSYWAQQCRFYNINHSTTAAYNPKDTLKVTANEHQDWVDQLPILLLGLRARPSSNSGLEMHKNVQNSTRNCRKPSRVTSTLTFQTIGETSQQPLRTWWPPPRSSSELRVMSDL